MFPACFDLPLPPVLVYVARLREVMIPPLLLPGHLVPIGAEFVGCVFENFRCIHRFVLVMQGIWRRGSFQADVRIQHLSNFTRVLSPCNTFVPGGHVFSPKVAKSRSIIACAP